VTRKDCGLCDGEGVIYDYSRAGDPCPECNGGRFTARGSVGYGVSEVRMHGGNCAVVAVLMLAGMTGAVWTLVDAVI